MPEKEDVLLEIEKKKKRDRIISLISAVVTAIIIIALIIFSIVLSVGCGHVSLGSFKDLKSPPILKNYVFFFIHSLTSAYCGANSEMFIKKSVRRHVNLVSTFIPAPAASLPSQ